MPLASGTQTPTSPLGDPRQMGPKPPVEHGHSPAFAEGPAGEAGRRQSLAHGHTDGEQRQREPLDHPVSRSEGRSSLLPWAVHCHHQPSAPVLQQAAPLLHVGPPGTLAAVQFPARLPPSGPCSCSLLTRQLRQGQQAG